ncbi:MAG: polysaccharide deacetylase family protein [Planctomycetaceae bacterium]
MIAPINKRVLLARMVGQRAFDPFIRRCSAWNGLLVLNYHRVGDPNGTLFDWELWSASEESFDAQMSYLAQNYDIVGPDDLEEIRRGQRGRHVMITFDDGYRDNYELAFPILKQHHTTATFFLTTGYLDHPSLAWWDEIAWMVRTSDRTGIDRAPWLSSEMTFDEPDRCRAIHQLLSIYKQLPHDETEQFLDSLADATGTGRAPVNLARDQWMTWEMAREMHREGMSLGGHTVSHPVLARHEPARQEQEISQCKQRIEDQIGASISVFAYPVGSRTAFDRQTQSLLSKHGFEAAFSFYGGYNSWDDWSPYDLRRVPIEQATTLAEFRALLSTPQVFAR